MTWNETQQTIKVCWVQSNTKAKLIWLWYTYGGDQYRLPLVNQTATRRLFKWRLVFTVCNTATDLDWSWFYSPLDLLIREESWLQTPLLHCSGNMPFAAKIKCVVLIWRLFVEVIIPKQAAWFGTHSGNYEKPTPFLMYGPLILVFLFFSLA